jgi:hypothetical protein
MGNDALTPAQAWDFLDGLRDEQKIIFAGEPTDIEFG